MRPRLAISFSGGRTSAVMLYHCIAEMGDSHDITIVFANTGCEHEETLRFVDAVDTNFCRPDGYQVYWIESVINGPGVGPSARVVDFKSASRNGEPFESAIAKHGVFGPSFPNCTGRLKSDPIHWFLRNEVGWEDGSYKTAIGIRRDEMIRMNRNADKEGLVYPLVDAGWRKRDVNEFMSNFEWDLKIPHDGWGNCTWCWKKSLRKLMTVTKEDPSVMDFPGRMERKFGNIDKSANQSQTEPRVFFRGNRSAQDILKLAFTERFEPYEDDKFNQMELFNELLDSGSSCGESCEIGADEKSIL